MSNSDNVITKIVPGWEIQSCYRCPYYEVDSGDVDDDDTCGLFRQLYGYEMYPDRVNTPWERTDGYPCSWGFPLSCPLKTKEVLGE